MRFAASRYSVLRSSLGGDGARYVVDMFFEELRGEFSHLGAVSVADVAAAETRHPGAWRVGANG